MEMMGEDAFEKLDPDMQDDIVKRFMSLRSGTDLQ
jgi:actin-like ATPase involved in cell morphogenesis